MNDRLLPIDYPVSYAYQQFRIALMCADANVRRVCLRGWIGEMGGLAAAW